MSKGFQFKQFFVAHDRCAMKVGTDGVLLGASLPLPLSPKGERGIRVLDIGTGTGLVALMIAQKLNTSPLEEVQWGLDAIDIDRNAVEQARENFENSPWAEHLHAHLCSLQDFQPAEPDTGSLLPVTYNLIISNPPYFDESLKNPDAQRNTARHTDTLSYEELIRHSRRLLAEDGVIQLILPIEKKDEILRIAAEHGLCATHVLYIHTTPTKAPKRFIVTLSKSADMQTEVEHLTLMGENGEPRSREYTELCKDYYL